MIDSHCHLADDAFLPDLDVVAARARDAGVASAMCILSADEPAELDRSTAVAAAWPGIRFATAIHPHRSGAYAGRVDDAVRTTRDAVARTSAVAVGEIGLDYHYDYSPRETQREVFAALVELAVALDKPVVIHTREATDDTVAILREAGRGRVRGVMHCFTGGTEEARKSLDLGFLLSFAGMLTFPKSEALRDVARFVPADRVLVETDAPFLAPVPHRGKRNEPAWVADTLARLASVAGWAVADTVARVTTNFEAMIAAGAPPPRVDTPAKPVF